MVIVAIRWNFWRAKPRDRVDPVTIGHLDQFATTRAGVEAFLEPVTTMTKASLLLVAADGEWTRRSIESAEWGRRFAARHKLPVYDAGVVGYPQRMRDFNERRKSSG